MYVYIYMCMHVYTRINIFVLFRFVCISRIYRRYCLPSNASKSRISGMYMVMYIKIWMYEYIWINMCMYVYI